jgi:drug/metabolite transporter (DMT)-like permease
MDIIQSVIANMTIILAIIGALAFVVSVVTQVIKGVGVFSKIPTDILVFVLSIGITVAAIVAYMQYIQTSILWYMILAAIIAGFIVAFVAMYGWEKLSELWTRFGKDVK